MMTDAALVVDTPQAPASATKPVRGSATPLHTTSPECQERLATQGFSGKESKFEAHLQFLRAICSKVPKRDGEWVAVGRRGEVCVMEDGTFDVWLVHPSRAPLSGHTINAVLKHVPAGIVVHKLTGEAWFQTTDTEIVRVLLKSLGIRQKRLLSEATKAQMASRLASYREARQGRRQPGAAADDEALEVTT